MVEDVTKNVVNSNLRTVRFTRSNLRQAFKNNGTPLAHYIKEDNYVNNLISGINSEEKALEMYERVKELFNQAAMNPRDWIFNFNKINEFISSDKKCKETVIKVLVLIWNTDRDMLQAATKEFENMKIVTTERQVLSTVAYLFDPLGLITPATIRMKLFLQVLWEKGKNWDEMLSRDEREECNIIVNNLKQLSQATIQRFVGNTSCQLLCFCDALEKCFATGVYIQTLHEGKVKVN